jgi:hypothetical protein
LFLSLTKLCARVSFTLFFHVRRFVIFYGWCTTRIMALSTRASVCTSRSRGLQEEEHSARRAAWPRAVNNATFNTVEAIGNFQHQPNDLRPGAAVPRGTTEQQSSQAAIMGRVPGLLSVANRFCSAQSTGGASWSTTGERHFWGGRFQVDHRVDQPSDISR